MFYSLNTPNFGDFQLYTGAHPCTRCDITFCVLMGMSNGVERGRECDHN